MRRNFRNKCAAFMACASVLGSKTSAMNANKNQVKSSQTLGAVGGAKTKKINWPKIVRICGFSAGGALALEIVHSLIGGLTDSEIGSYSFGRLMRNHVKKNKQPEFGNPDDKNPNIDGNEHNPGDKDPKILNGTGKKGGSSQPKINVAQHNQQLIQNAFNNITNADQDTVNYSQDFKLLDKNTELEVVKKFLDEAKRYFLNPVQENFSKYLNHFHASGSNVRYATVNWELSGGGDYEAKKEKLAKEMVDNKFVILDESVKKNIKLDDNQNTYINFIAGCLNGQNKLDSFKIKREIDIVGKICYKFEFVSNNNKIIFYWYNELMLEIHFNNSELIYNWPFDGKNLPKLEDKMFKLAKIQ